MMRLRGTRLFFAEIACATRGMFHHGLPGLRLTGAGLMRSG